MNGPGNNALAVSVHLPPTDDESPRRKDWLWNSRAGALNKKVTDCILG